MCHDSDYAHLLEGPEEAQRQLLEELEGEAVFTISPKLGEVLAAADRRHRAGEFTSWVEALRAVHAEAEGEPRLEGVEPPDPWAEVPYPSEPLWVEREPEPRHPLLAAADALGLSDCPAGCTCRGSQATR